MSSLVAMPGRYRPAPCASRPDRGRWGAASACSPASGGCACRCPGRACPTATRGRSRRATGSCSSTPGRTSRARSPSSSARSTRSACASSTCACSSARTRTPTTAARPGRSSSARAASSGPIPTSPTSTRWPTTPRRPTPAGSRSRARAACRWSRPTAAARSPPGRSRPTATSLPGVEVETDLGAWSVHETPGHAPSHVCLFQAERRLLISGDHLLGRVSLYFDYGFSPDPVGEFLALARRDRRPQCPARAERPRPPVLRRPRAPRRQPAARPGAPRRRPGRARGRPEHRLRPPPGGLRRRVQARVRRAGR